MAIIMTTEATGDWQNIQWCTVLITSSAVRTHTGQQLARATLRERVPLGQQRAEAALPKAMAEHE